MLDAYQDKTREKDLGGRQGKAPELPLKDQLWINLYQENLAISYKQFSPLSDFLHPSKVLHHPPLAGSVSALPIFHSVSPFHSVLPLVSPSGNSSHLPGSWLQTPGLLAPSSHSFIKAEVLLFHPHPQPRASCASSVSSLWGSMHTTGYFLTAPSFWIIPSLLSGSHQLPPFMH